MTATTDLQPTMPTLSTESRTKTYRIAIAGNPNTGKTSLFNNITGSRHKVANWPGVTVEKKEGQVIFQGQALEIIDLPGTYSLTTYSMEELVARNFILNERPDVIIQVIDATNVERNLYLYTQLRELKTRVVIALNMWDEAVEYGYQFDLERLSLLLGAPIVPTVARINKGTDALLEQALYTARRPVSPRPLSINYGPEISAEIDKLTHILRPISSENTRWQAIKLLENDTDVLDKLPLNGDRPGLVTQIETSRSRIKSFYDDDPEIIIAERRYGFVHGACQETIKPPAQEKVNVTQLIDRALTNRILGFPIFIFFIWGLFQITFTVGQYPMDWIDTAVGWISEIVSKAIPNGPLRALFVDGIINGVGSVIVFLPNILILFFGISLMEDTGYMARAAFLMDRIMRSLGLHGKSFIPLVMGFGCNVPAIMATRALESQRDRILTILINPLMSCNARLPVYILFAGAFFSERTAGNIIFGLYAFGVMLAMLLGRLFSKTLLKGEPSHFVLELPPYRVPTLKSVFYHMWDRGSIYLRKMGGVILLSSIIIWFLGAFPKLEHYSQDYDGAIQQTRAQFAVQTQGIAAESTEYGRLQTAFDTTISAILAQKHAEAQKHTFIGQIGHWIEPVIAPLGFDWKLGVALITGFVAKEIVVSTTGVLYQISDQSDENSEGLRNALRQSGMTPLVAFGFMVFVLIYTPCLVTVVAIKRETGSWGWMWFAIGYELTLAWALAFIIYRVGSLFGLS